MASASTKRARSKRGKPQLLKLSFGSSSGASSSLPSTMASLSEVVTQLEIKRQETQLEDDCCYYWADANGNVTRWSPSHEYCPQDFETDSPEDLDYGPDLARQDFELDHPEAVENGRDSVGIKDDGGPPMVVAGGAEVLTEADMADIVRRCRAFLEERGPSQEEELCCQEVLGAHRADLVQTSIGSLVAFLSKQPGFHHTREGDLSFLYYMDPEEEEGESATAEPPLSPSTASGLPLSAGSTEGGPGEAGAVAEGDVLQSGHVSPCGSSSPSHSSYVSAVDDLEGLEERRRRDACNQTAPTGQEKAPSCCSCQGHGAQKDMHDRHTQTSCLDTAQLAEEELRLKEKIRALEAKIASLEDDHDREIRELRLAFEGLQRQCRCQQQQPPPYPLSQPKQQQRSLQEVANGCATTGMEKAHYGTKYSQFTRPVVPDDVLLNGVYTEEDGVEDGSHAGCPSHSGGGVGTVLNGASSWTEEEAVHSDKEQEGSPSGPPVAKPIQAEAENGASAPNARQPCHRVPDFAELHRRLEQSRRASSCVDLDSSVGGVGASPCDSTCSTPGSKTEAQMAKIVRQIKKKLPHWSEADVREQVAQVRRLQGGFSCMTINDIVALVLGYISQNGGQARNDEN